MTLKFPVLTAPPNDFGFLEEFKRILDEDFRVLVVVSPFVDAFIIRNIINKCAFRKREVTVITRYRTLTEDNRREVRKAIQEISKTEKKDPTLPEKVTWYENSRLHAKFIVRDWTEILLGSQNLTKKGGLTRNYELGVLLQDPELVKAIQPFVGTLVATSKKGKLYPRG